MRWSPPVNKVAYSRSMCAPLNTGASLCPFHFRRELDACAFPGRKVLALCQQGLMDALRSENRAPLTKTVAKVGNSLTIANRSTNTCCRCRPVQIPGLASKTCKHAYQPLRIVHDHLHDHRSS